MIIFVHIVDHGRDERDPDLRVREKNPMRTQMRDTRDSEWRDNLEIKNKLIKRSASLDQLPKFSDYKFVVGFLGA